MATTEIRQEFVIVFLGRVVLSVLGVALLFTLLKLLDSTEYSVYVFFFSTASWLGALFFAAANIPLMNIVSKYSSQPTETIKINKFVLNLISYFGFVAFPICAIVCLVLFSLIDSKAIGLSLFNIFLVSMLAISSGVMSITSTYLMALRRRVSNTSINSGTFLLKIALLFICVYVFQLDVNNIGQSALFAVSVATFVGAMCSVIWVFGVSSLYSRSELLFDIKRYKLNYSYFHNWPVSVGNNFFLFGDKVIFAFVLPIELIGILAVYQQYSRMLANVSSGAVYQFFAPIMLGNNKNIVRRDSSFAVYIALCALLITALPGYFFLDLINEYLLAGKFELRGLEYFLVILSVGLVSVTRIVELEFFKKNLVHKLKFSLLYSLLAFLIPGVILAKYFQLGGAIAGIIVAALVRLYYTSKILREIRSTKILD